MIFFISSWANFKASRKTSSEIRSASPSTITIVSLFPDTTNSIDDSSICSLVGFTIKFSSTFASLTVAIGPFHGISDTINAAEAPTPARTSAGLSPSVVKTVIIT